MEKKVVLLEYSTRIVYSIEGLSGDLKVYWSRILSIIFSESLQENQIQFGESKAATSRFKNSEEIIAFGEVLERDQLEWALGLVAALAVKAEREGDQLAANRIHQTIEKLIQRNDPTMAVNIAQKCEAFQKQFDEIEIRLIVKIPARIWPLTLDYLLRWLLLMAVSFGAISQDRFIGSNFFLITFAVCALVFLVSRKDGQYNQALLLRYGGANKFKLRSQVSSTQYTALAFFLASSLFVNYLLTTSPDDAALESLVVLLSFALYYTFCLRIFKVGRIRESDLASQVAAAGNEKKAWSADENDEAIVSLETRLNAVTSRLEAYVVESALFGALSFSGFLQIIANNIISFKDMDRFAEEVKQTSTAFVHFDGSSFYAGLNGLGTDKSLFCLVSVETLVCSIFFLAVIASRLQFSDVADKVREALNLAKAFNDKEEALLEKETITEKGDQRLSLLNAKINEQIDRAVKATDELRPVIQYMQYFRNAGIIVFLILLVNSSLFITGALGWAFAVLGAATWIYFNRNSLSRSLRPWLLSLRVRLVSYAQQGALVAGAGSFVAAFTLRIVFKLENTDFILQLGIIILGLYGCIWIIFFPHRDYVYEGSPFYNENRLKGSGWRLTRNLLAIGIFFASLGVIFKFNLLNGANELLLISLTTLSFLSYFLNYHLTQKGLFWIIGGMGMSTTGVGSLFKLLRLPGADDMLLFGLIALILILVICTLKRANFHQLLIRSYLMVLASNLYFSSGIFLGGGGVYDIISLGYHHKTFDLRDINEMTGDVYEFRDDPDPGIRKMKLEHCIVDCDRYIDKYGETGHPRIFSFLSKGYKNAVNDMLDSIRIEKPPPSDSTRSALLRLALRAAHQSSKIQRLFKFNRVELPASVELEADVLLLMGKKEKAIEVLRDFLGDDAPPDLKQSADLKLRGIENQ